MSKAFAGLTKSGAQRFTRTLVAHRDLVPSIRLQGLWLGRRFVVAAILPGSAPVAVATPDFETLSLTLPIVSDYAFYVREAARFGGAVEAWFRKRKSFENVPGADEKTHIVHAYHHVALCGHKGPWPEIKSLSDFSKTKNKCCDCDRVALTPPKYRARMHPLTK